MKPLVISLCDFTGNAVSPWADRGYECWCFDLRHERTSTNGNVTKTFADVHQVCIPKDRRIAFVFAFPPCTHLAVSGARWFKGKGLDALADSIKTVAACARLCEESGAPYLIENPVSTLATYWRKPDYSFDPCEYAGYLDNPSLEAYTKKTCLWTGGSFVMPERKSVEPVLGSKMHLLPPSEDRANLRSATPMGFSKAVFLANHKN